MTTSDWRDDKIAAFIFFVFAVITGAVSQFWLVSFFVWSTVFFIWKYLELRRFYQWYKSGAPKHDVPMNNGIFEVLTTLVLHNKKETALSQKRNQYLIEQFNTTAQALPFATVLLNDRFEIQWSNERARSLLNIRPKDLHQLVSNTLREPAFVSMLGNGESDQSLKLNHPIDPDKKLQLRLIKLNRYRHLLVASDISAQEALQKSRKAFVANASHELRTPLTVISGYLEMIQSSGQVPEDWSEAIEQTLYQSNRMEQIIADMLKLATIEHDRHIEGSSQVIDMPLLLNKLFNDVKNSQQASTHVFTAQIDSGMRIEGNESEIASVCLNLLRNAVIHTPDQTRVHLRWFKDDEDRANLWISDNGEGIDGKHIPHLTERFYRVDNSRTKNIQSTGLGLAIVKHICLSHNATLDIDSKKGEGTTFKIQFPYAIS
ncbi:phosphate regulon sensor histidine kinase PhoR [Marinicella rhabdoformis]|uniref:phosphate regulon sensor histidine kinase PhoR n=1 Tax=Marinicella rhabdoformis TaxID=2580566 RepID=UPI0012AEB583|nr:phosphate regulon sensor histidine kinase PhoR [Marinicella rhabdoformis]